jgi:kynurenine formamidase
MSWIDFSHIISPSMSTFPGTPAPELSTVATVPANYYRETKLQLYSHMGTHIDAPAHIIENGRTLDQFPAEHFIGSAVVIPCTPKCMPGEPYPVIDISALEPYMEAAEAADFLIFSTGWESKWNDPTSYRSSYPILAPDIAFFAATRHKKGIGVDTLSPDRPDKLHFHRAFLSSEEGVTIENLCNLNSVPAGELFPLCALPLLFENADGAPARVLGEI